MLEIPESFMDDAGNYTIKAINIEGETKCSCILKIIASSNPMPIPIEPISIQPTGFPPAFLQLFIDRQTLTGVSVKFEARLTGTLPLNVCSKSHLFLILLIAWACYFFICLI